MMFHKAVTEGHCNFKTKHSDIEMHLSCQSFLHLDLMIAIILMIHGVMTDDTLEGNDILSYHFKV